MIRIGNSASNISVYTSQPKDKAVLKEIIIKRISKEGPNCDLNDIDVSLIEDMSYLFCHSEFAGDISNWNTSNVKNMRGMFFYSKFNGDISRWNVRNMKDTCCMFEGSSFDGDISNWYLKEDCNARFMFDNSLVIDEYRPKSHLYY